MTQKKIAYFFASRGGCLHKGSFSADRSGIDINRLTAKCRTILLRWSVLKEKFNCCDVSCDRSLMKRRPLKFILVVDVRLLAHDLLEHLQVLLALFWTLITPKRTGIRKCRHLCVCYGVIDRIVTGVEDLFYFGEIIPLYLRIYDLSCFFYEVWWISFHFCFGIKFMYVTLNLL